MAIDFSAWDQKSRSVASLLLDPRNPRIPTVGLEQRAIIAELLAHDDVDGLARDIAESGYIPGESLIAVIEDGKTYVLEGNRRLAALKLLLNAEVAPPKDLNRIRKLGKLAGLDAAMKVPLMVAPSREAAAPVIVKKHTGDQVRRWAPLMQARYFRSLLDGGLTTGQMAEQYKKPKNEIVQSLRLDTMYGVALRMDLPPDVAAIVHDPRAFTASALERVLDSPIARERLGLNFDPKDETVQGCVKIAAFRRAFTRVLTDIALKREDTRTLNAAEDVKAYIEKRMVGDLPTNADKGHFAIGDFAKRSDVPGASAPNAALPKKKKGRGPAKSSSIVPSGTRCELKSSRINHIFEEMRKLKVETHTNATAVLFRIFAELCIGHYLVRSKQIKPLLDKLKNENKGREHFPSFRQMLIQILKDPSINVEHPQALKALNKMVSDPKASLSLDNLDMFVHNEFVTPTPHQLRSFWEMFDGLFKVILIEYKGP